MFWRVVRWPAPAAELVGDAASCSSCAAVSRPPGILHADHLHARLALAVDAETQAERAELVLSDGARENLLRPLAEPLDFGTNGLFVLEVEFLASVQA